MTVEMNDERIRIQQELEMDILYRAFEEDDDQEMRRLSGNCSMRLRYDSHKTFWSCSCF